LFVWFIGSMPLCDSSETYMWALWLCLRPPTCCLTEPQVSPRSPGSRA
jgi:hypothetical protein